MRFTYILPGLVFALLAGSCKPELEGPAPKTEPLDLSRYVAAGDYLAAGFANGGVTSESQQYAYPNILAQQFAKAGNAPATFVQPYFSPGGGTQTISLASLNANGVPVLNGTEEFFKFIRQGCSAGPASTYEQFSSSAAQTATIQNFGVPGLLLTHIRRAGLGNEANAGSPANFNPYFERMLPPGDDRTYVEVVSGANPTFFTLWVGTSDIVNYALSGATCTAGLPPLTTFRSEVTVLLDSLSRTRRQANNRFLSTRKGLICNIPSVRDFGFNRLVNPMELEKSYQAQYGAGSKIWIRKKSRPFDTSYEDAMVSSNDVILIKGLNALGQEVTVTVNGTPTQVRHGLSEYSPLANDEVLDATEINEMETQIASYNSEINRLITGASLPYRGTVFIADMRGLFNDLKNGINYNGVIYNMDPIKGGITSLDLFSFTPRGQAFIANKIIQTMNLNNTFGTRIQEVNVNDMPLLKMQ